MRVSERYITTHIKKHTTLYHKTTSPLGVERPFHTRQASFWLMGFKWKAPRSPREASNYIFHIEIAFGSMVVLSLLLWHQKKREFTVLAFNPPSCFFSRPRVRPPRSPKGLKSKPSANNMKHTMLELLIAMDDLGFITRDFILLMEFQQPFEQQECGRTGITTIPSRNSSRIQEHKGQAATALTAFSFWQSHGCAFPLISCMIQISSSGTTHPLVMEGSTWPPKHSILVEVLSHPAHSEDILSNMQWEHQDFLEELSFLSM